MHKNEYVVHQTGLHPHDEIENCEIMNLIIVGHPYCDENTPCQGQLEEFSFDMTIEGAAQIISIIELSASQHGLKEALSARLDQVRMHMKHDKSWWKDERTEH